MLKTRALLLSLCLLVALALGACRQAGDFLVLGTPGPNLYEEVHHLPCPQVRQYVRDRLAQDPELGLDEQSQEAKLAIYQIPKRSDSDLTWSAQVYVQCTGPLSSQLSAQVWAQHRVQGGWQQVEDTTKLERMILDKITPKP